MTDLIQKTPQGAESVDEKFFTKAVGYFILYIQQLIRERYAPFFFYLFIMIPGVRPKISGKEELNMDLRYKMFVDQLRRELLAATGLPESRIFFVPRGEEMARGGDRLFVECAHYEDAREVCGIFMEELYDRFLEGISLCELIQDILMELERIKTNGFYEKTRRLADYALVKNDLFIRLLNYERNKNDLRYAVYRCIGDIAMVLYMKVGEENGCITSMKIRRDYVEKWGQDENYVFEEALKNTRVLAPPRVYRWEQLIFDENYQGDDFMSENAGSYLCKGAVGNCISTLAKTNGAVAIFFPGVAEYISECLGHDLYLVFTSIHEVMVHNAENVRPEELEDVLRETIKEATPESDYLTSSIYYYSRRRKEFSCLGCSRA